MASLAPASDKLSVRVDHGRFNSGHDWSSDRHDHLRPLSRAVFGEFFLPSIGVTGFGDISFYRPFLHLRASQQWRTEEGVGSPPDEKRRHIRTRQRKNVSEGVG